MLVFLSGADNFAVSCIIFDVEDNFSRWTAGLTLQNYYSVKTFQNAETLDVLVVIFKIIELLQNVVN